MSNWTDSMSPEVRDEVIRRYLDQMRQMYEAGNPLAVLEGVRFCAITEIPQPKWLADAFVSAINPWFNKETKTLDEAFGVEWPKGVHINAARKRQKLSPAVWLAVAEARDEGVPLDDELFDQIGRDLGIGKTLAKEYYYARFGGSKEIEP